MKTAKVIYDSTERSADLYYVCRFSAHSDAFIFFETAGKKYIVLSDLEIDRGKKEATVERVLSLTKYQKLAKARGKDPRDEVEILDLIFKEFKIKRLIMPSTTGFDLIDRLRKKGYRIESGPYPFYSERHIKRPEEAREIERVQRAIFAAMRMVEDVLRKSVIKKNLLYYKGRVLTSEWMKEMINVLLLQKGCVSTDGPIVSCGKDAIEPHSNGSGPLRPHGAIIVDVFPRSQETLYFGDATRTFCKGKASKELKDLYKTVKAAQEFGIKNIRAGINGHKIHKGIHKLMESRGYKTGEKDGRMQGFIHSTGHGIGLELHEEPMRIGPKDYKLKAGHVFSVEPGLYYKGIGGVRIEDLVLVTRRGCKILSGYPKRLEVD